MVFANTGKKASGSGEDGEAKSEEEKKKEEDDKKKKDEEEEKKKKEEAKKKKEAATGEVEVTKSSVSKKTEQVLQTVSGIEKTYSKSDKERHRATTEKLKTLGVKFKKINQEDAENQLEVKEILDRLIQEGKITKEKAQEIMDLDPVMADYDDKWSEIIASVPELRQKEPYTIAKIKDLKEKEAEKSVKLTAEFDKALKEFRELMEASKNEVLQKAYKEKALKQLSTLVGLPVQDDQKLVSLGLLEDPETKKLKNYRQYYRIKKVDFEEIEIKDDKGNVTGTIKTNTPVVTIESQDPVSGKVGEDKFSPAELNKWVENIGVTEDIQTLKDLEKSTGEKIKEGDVFEIRVKELPTPEGNNNGKDLKIKIKKIDEIKQEIELDEPLDFRGKKTRYLEFGEFARWFKKNEALRPIESLTKLRNELGLHVDYLDSIYNRQPGHYRPIEVKEGEVLHYDDDSGTQFVIKKVSDQGVELDTGDAFTLAAFLRWVKKNEVEKRDPDAEAERVTQHEQDEATKKIEKEKVKKQVEEQMNDRKEAAKDPAKLAAMPHADDPAKPSASYLKMLWTQTEFLSLGDLWEFGKTIAEFVKRKMHRWQHGKVGRYGEAVFKTLGAPFHNAKGALGGFAKGLTTELGAEFKGVAQHAENEEVNHHVHHLETMGIETVKHELHEAANTDILKAAVTVLCKKGQMRWDDHAFWGCVNRLSNGMPKMIDAKTHLDDIELIFDGWWGQDTFREFKNSQESGYNSVKNNFKDNAMRLEAVPNGLRMALKSKLLMHLSGKYVNPAEYEEYVHFAIEAGKLSFTDKLYYLIAGVGADGHDDHGHGMTLLHFDRVGAIESALLNNFPVLDYFVQEQMSAFDDHGEPVFKKYPNGEIMKDEHGNPIQETTGKAQLGNFRRWINDLILADMKESLAENGHSISSLTDLRNVPEDAMEAIGPGKRFNKFVKEVMMWSDSTKTRLKKAVSDCSRWDHDDMDYFAPQLTEDTVDNLTRYAGGARQQVSTPGLLNACMGFNDFARVKLDMMKAKLSGEKKDKGGAQKDLREFMDLLRTQIRFHAIVDKRFEHKERGMSRLGAAEQKQKPLNDDSRPVADHLGEVEAFIRGLCKELGMMEECNIVYRRHQGIPPDEAASLQSNTIREFGKRLEGAIANYTNNDPEKTMDLFKRAGERMILGRGNAPQEKGEYKEIPRDVILEKYKDDEIEKLVAEYKAIEEQKAATAEKTKEQVDQEQNVRVQEIVEQVDAERYNPQPNDKKLMQDAITGLREKKRPKKAD